MNKTSGSNKKKKDQPENQPAQNAPQSNQWERVPGEPGERSDKESIGRPVQLDNEKREQDGQPRPDHGERSSPAHADKSRI